MTDEERDQIDTDAETYMRTCSVAIHSLKNEGTHVLHTQLYEDVLKKKQSKLVCSLFTDPILYHMS